MENYAVLALETHLYYARIMKEHALFLEVGFPCKDSRWIQKANQFRKEFEEFLSDILPLANGRINPCILDSGELFTEFTIAAERKTEQLCGIAIDSRVSQMEQKLAPISIYQESREFDQLVGTINERALGILDSLIAYKEEVSENVAKGELYNAYYPLLLEHIIREAKLYQSTLLELQQGIYNAYPLFWKTELFWNQIMLEHALFVRGLLNPTDGEQIQMAEKFAKSYEKLLERAKCSDLKAKEGLKRECLEETVRYRDFGIGELDGILNNQLAAVILPILADHILREANHYIRLLGKECGQSQVWQGAGFQGE